MRKPYHANTQGKGPTASQDESRVPTDGISEDLIPKIMKRFDEMDQHFDMIEDHFDSINQNYRPFIETERWFMEAETPAVVILNRPRH